MNARASGPRSPGALADPRRRSAGDGPRDEPPHVSAFRVRAGGHDWHVARVVGAGADPTRTPDGSRPVCLCLHGTGASSHSMLGLAAELAATHDVLAPDLPAHAATRTGRSADLSIEGVAASVGALLDALEVRPALLVGHSAGAVVLAERLLARGDRAAPPLVSLAGSLLPLGGPAGALFPPLARLAAETGWVAGLFARRAAREPGHVRRLLASTGSTVPAPSLATYRALLSDREHVRGVLRLMAAWRLDAFAARLPGLDARVHLIGGSADGTIPPAHQRRLERILPRATLDVLDPLGHLLHEEAPERVAATLLARLDAPRAAPRTALHAAPRPDAAGRPETSP